MATAVAVGPGTATLTPALGGAVLRSVVSGATLLSAAIGDAHILTVPVNPVATAGSAVVGTSTVG